MSDKLKVFLSGGMSNISEEDSKKWRNLFEKKRFRNVISRIYYSDYYIFLNPTKLYNPTEPYNQTYEKEAMNYDLYLVKHSDIIIVNFNSLSSIGTAQEVMYAHILNKPIIGMIEKDKYDQLHPWYKEECMKIFKYEPKELEEVINEIIEYIWRFNLKEEN